MESRTARSAESPRAPREDTAYFYGIRGVSALVIMTFHCDLIIHYMPHHHVSKLYELLTAWLRFGDFRVVPFFIISGYLLTLPATKNASWPLSRGLAGFFKRRIERVVYPYYFALALSVVLFVIWRTYVGHPVHLAHLAEGVLAHLALVHNLHPKTVMYVNDVLWTVALECQCYVLMALVFLPLMRRSGAWAPLVAVGAAAVVGFGAHFALAGGLDTTRPWFIVVFALGMAAGALRNSAFPIFGRIERAVPWGTVWLACTAGGLVLTAFEGVDPPYWRCWPSVMLIGIAFASFVIYLRGPRAGVLGRLTKPLVKLLETPSLMKLGRFSFSVYLTHFPVYRLLLAIVASRTDSVWIQGALGYFVFTPVCLMVAYAFHVRFERPFQTSRPELVPAGAAVGAGTPQQRAAM